MPDPRAQPVLSGLSPEEIVRDTGLAPAFRGVQVFRWIHRGTVSFDEMTDLGKDDRERLSASTRLRSSKILSSVVDEDSTGKYLIGLDDGLKIEAVLLTDEEDRSTACLSSQAGCAMGCQFCRTASMGLRRQLETHEIVEEYLLLQFLCDRIDNVVFMGMGEPLGNTDRVFRAIELLHDPRGTNLGLRKFTVSTSGLPEGIMRLGKELPQVKLAVSLVTADPKLRAELMPAAGRFPLEVLKRSLLDYQKLADRRITLEVVLLGGVNDRPEEAKLLRAFADGLDILINVIPWNPCDGLPFRSPSEESVRDFCRRLEDLGLSCTRRYRRGRGINGACGQLAVLENGPDPANAGG